MTDEGVSEVSRRARKAHEYSRQITIAQGERYVRCSSLGDSWDDWPHVLGGGIRYALEAKREPNRGRLLGGRGDVGGDPGRWIGERPFVLGMGADAALAAPRRDGGSVRGQSSPSTRNFFRARSTRLPMFPMFALP